VVYSWTRWALRGLRGIEPWEVMQILTGRRPRWPRPGQDTTGLQMLTLWGRTKTGRALIVGVYPDPHEPWEWDIAGAREMTAGELAEFERWEQTQ
jgi:hypothetical protein